MYSVAAFGRMIADEVRTGAYEAAIAATVRPGAVVLDIGAGTGILSLLACRAGARKVYAIEGGDAIAVAAEIARAHGLADRIEFIHAKSTDVTLPERADVIVSDLRGVLPLFDHHIPSIADARRRHLATGGVLIPLRDELHVGLVEAPEDYARLVAPWSATRFGFEMAAARRIVTNAWERAFFRADQLLCASAPWVTLDYTTIESADVHGTMTLTATRAGTAHGIAAWFDAVLCDGIGYSNAPGQPETVYGTGFFPLSEPIDVVPGDRVTVTLRADLIGGEYITSWETAAFRGDAGTAHVRLSQSTFFGGPMPMEKIRKRAAAHTPVLNDDGEVDAAILSAMTGGQAVEVIATDILERFPDRFRTRAEALARVGDLSERYSQ